MSKVAYLSLTPQERSDIQELLICEATQYYASLYPGFHSSCFSIAEKLPTRIHDWHKTTLDSGIGIIHNLPIEQALPPTPLERGIADNLSMTSDTLVGALSLLFGHIGTYKEKQVQRHIHNIYPIKEDEQSQLGSASKASLFWHVEEALLINRPDWICLLCLRKGSENVETRVAHMNDLRIDHNLRRYLMQHKFKLDIDETYNAASSPPPVELTLFKNNEIIFDPAYTRKETRQEHKAIESVCKAADRTCHRFSLDSGDCLLINNRTTMHARNCFRAQMNGTDRWIKRSLIFEESNFEGHRNGYVEAVYAQNEHQTGRKQ